MKKKTRLRTLIVSDLKTSVELPEKNPARTHRPLVVPILIEKRPNSPKRPKATEDGVTMNADSHRAKPKINPSRYGRFRVLVTMLVLALVVAACGGVQTSDAGSNADDGASSNDGSVASDETTTTAGSESEQASTPAHATVEFDGQVYDFDEASTCFFRDGAPPLIATFGEEIVPEGDNGLKIGRASQDSRLILVIGGDRWDTRTSQLPQIVGGTATWDAIEMGRLAESASGAGTDIMTITINC